MQVGVFVCGIKANTDQHQPNGVRQLWHFIQQFLLIASMLWDLLAMSENAWRVSTTGCVPCSSGPSLLIFQLLAAVYGIAVSYRLRRFRAGLRENYSSLAGRDLKLGELAERIGTSPQLLSQYLNEALGLSFFEHLL